MSLWTVLRAWLRPVSSAAVQAPESRSFTVPADCQKWLELDPIYYRTVEFIRSSSNPKVIQCRIYDSSIATSGSATSEAPTMNEAFELALAKTPHWWPSI